MESNNNYNNNVNNNNVNNNNNNNNVNNDNEWKTIGKKTSRPQTNGYQNRPTDTRSSNNYYGNSSFSNNNNNYNNRSSNNNYNNRPSLNNNNSYNNRPNVNNNNNYNNRPSPNNNNNYNNHSNNNIVSLSSRSNSNLNQLIDQQITNFFADTNNWTREKIDDFVIKMSNACNDSSVIKLNIFLELIKIAIYQKDAFDLLIKLTYSDFLSKKGQSNYLKSDYNPIQILMWLHKSSHNQEECDRITKLVAIFICDLDYNIFKMNSKGENCISSLIARRDNKRRDKLTPEEFRFRYDAITKNLPDKAIKAMINGCLNKALNEANVRILEQLQFCIACNPEQAMDQIANILLTQQSPVNIFSEDFILLKVLKFVNNVLTCNFTKSNDFNIFFENVKKPDLDECVSMLLDAVEKYAFDNKHIYYQDRLRIMAIIFGFFANRNHKVKLFNHLAEQCFNPTDNKFQQIDQENRIIMGILSIVQFGSLSVELKKIINVAYNKCNMMLKVKLEQGLAIVLKKDVNKNEIMDWGNNKVNQVNQVNKKVNPKVNPKVNKKTTTSTTTSTKVEIKMEIKVDVTITNKTYDENVDVPESTDSLPKTKLIFDFKNISDTIDDLNFIIGQLSKTFAPEKIIIKILYELLNKINTTVLIVNKTETTIYNQGLKICSELINPSVISESSKLPKDSWIRAIQLLQNCEDEEDLPLSPKFCEDVIQLIN